ncbi:putative membrane protein [Wickerhamomyces ciferrii]|uniref:Protein YIP n=1 Tax=Wickerhamomyces ciferrii (strain ATCC 14091 / BCRC 22168 / CBS 111 / JCM 3599 / NBRC 0793 / NRRL Y-1031 F-60-10) TaxID=1206466 RepID=K0L039_WICCF|nr:uncharacterized protein BN7_6352 [Wickerhamomyces ciferrii]CCH46753.1 putative membrane protein [Wickerhamomyces ciferrii]
MSQWKPVNVDPNHADDFDLEPDFIEPDDATTPINKNKSQYSSAQQQQQNQYQLNQGQGQSSNSFFNFSSFTTPNIDLSNSLNPILNNENVKERKFSGGDTLDEPVWDTLKRDLVAIGHRLFSVVWPASLSKLAKVQQHNLLIAARNSGINIGINYDQIEQDLEQDLQNQPIDDSNLKKLDWDLWGPLIFILIFSLILGYLSPKTNTSQVFSSVFALTWLTFAVIAINIQLLGGTISFFSALSTQGYALFPLVISSIISIFIKWSFIRFIIYLLFVSWAIYAATINLKVSGVLPGRIFLAIYPVGLVYATLGWLCVIT